MPFLYSAIARGSTIICCHQQEQLSNPQSSSSFGNENYNQANYSLLVSNILPNISTTSNANTSYTTNNEVMINVMVDGGLVFLCACNGDISKQRAFEFLAEIKSTFTSSQALVHRAATASSNELNRDFAPVMAKKMVEFSIAPVPTDSLSIVQAQVEDVKGVMTRNIEAVLDRGQKLEDLMDKSNDLEANASSFQRTTRRVHRKMWWRNTKTTLACGLVIIIALIIIVVIILFSTGVFPIHTDAKTTTTTTTTAATTTIKARKAGMHRNLLDPVTTTTHQPTTTNIQILATTPSAQPSTTLQLPTTTSQPPATTTTNTLLTTFEHHEEVITAGESEVEE